MFHNNHYILVKYFRTGFPRQQSLQNIYLYRRVKFVAFVILLSLETMISVINSHFNLWHVIFPCSGYMAPEYAMHGQISTKSDVYSFGVLVLEILMGKKCTRFYGPNSAMDLISYVRMIITEYGENSSSENS